MAVRLYITDRLCFAACPQENPPREGSGEAQLRKKSLSSVEHSNLMESTVKYLRGKKFKGNDNCDTAHISLEAKAII